MATDGTPWWDVLGIDRNTASALHFVRDQSSVVASVQHAFVKELKRLSVRNVNGLMWAQPGEFDDLVRAVHNAWRELGVEDRTI